jgi:general secretion pathway protein C
MAAQWLSFVIWAAVAAGGAFWSLRLLVPSTAAPAHTVTVSAAAVARGDLTRVLGFDPPPTAEAAAPVAEAERRFQLLGVVAPRGITASEGVALIAIDGNPPKAYRVGASVDGETVLQSVSMRGAALGPRGGAATVSLATPPPAPPATGVLPPAIPGVAGAARQGVPAPGAPSATRGATARPVLPVPLSAAGPAAPAAAAQGEEVVPERAPEGAATR